MRVHSNVVERLEQLTDAVAAVDVGVGVAVGLLMSGLKLHVQVTVALLRIDTVAAGTAAGQRRALASSIRFAVVR